MSMSSPFSIDFLNMSIVITSWAERTNVTIAGGEKHYELTKLRTANHLHFRFVFHIREEKNRERRNIAGRLSVACVLMVRRAQ